MLHRPFNSFAMLPLALSFCITTPCTASAQTQALSPALDPRHQTPKDLDAVVVTANPLRSTAEELSKPTEILSGEQLDAAKSNTLGETLNKLPGVQGATFGAGVSRPVIRGMDGPRVSILSSGMGTADVSSVSQDHGVAIEPFLADQIEVLKGPATLLYGNGAIGGAVNLVDGRIAEHPLDRPLTGRAELRASRVDDGFTGMARADAMGADGALVLHADALYRNQHDYDTPRGVQRNTFVDSKVGALGASLVGEDRFFGVSATRYENSYGNPGEPGDATLGERGVHLQMRQNRFEARGGIDSGIGPFDGLRAALAHTGYEHVEYEDDEVGTRFFSDASEGRVELTHHANSWKGALGLQALQRTFQAIGEEAFVPRTRTRNAGFFVVEQFKYAALQLDGGARVEKTRLSPEALDARGFTPLSLSLGALWKFNNSWRVTLNLDRAERAPAEEELFAYGPHAATASFEIGDAQLRKERAQQAELGLHYHGERLEAKLSGYYNRFSAFIYLADAGRFEDDLPVRQWTQGDTTFRGMEGEAIAHLFDTENGTLDLRVFGDRVRATLNTGGNLPRIPPARLGAQAMWRAQHWRAGLGTTHYTRQNDVAAGEIPTAGYTLADAHFAWHTDTGPLAWELFLDATNLTDATARMHTSFLKDRVILPGRGFNLGVRVFF